MFNPSANGLKIKEFLKASKIAEIPLIKYFRFNCNQTVPMTCYFKNSRTTDLFAELGVNVTKENMKELDELLHEYLSVDYKNCAATWKIIRKRLEEDGEGFKQRLRELLVAYA